MPRWYGTICSICYNPVFNSFLKITLSMIYETWHTLEYYVFPFNIKVNFLNNLTLITSPLPDVELFVKVGNQENHAVKICFLFSFLLTWPPRWLKHSTGCNLKNWPKRILSLPEADSASLNHSFTLWYCTYIVLETLFRQPFIPNFKAHVMRGSHITFSIVIQTGTG